jgi:diguanylate cyclase (GGDEF)-like protein/PAS domain S-box-containing protein
MTAAASNPSALFPTPLLRGPLSHALLGTEAEQEFDDLAELAAGICGTPVSLVTLLDMEWQYHKGSVGLEMDRLPRQDSFCAHAIEQDELFIVHDAHADPRFANNPLVTGEPKIRFYAGMPLHAGPGLKVGALCVIDSIARVLKQGQLRALTLLARQVNVHLELKLKRMEAEMTLEAVKTSEAMFCTFLNTVPFSCYLKDRQGRLKLYNASMAQRFGISETEWLGRTNSDLWPMDVAQALDFEEARVFAQGEQVVSYAQTPDAQGGSTHWKLHQVPCRSSNGEEMLAGIAVDVTEEVHQKRQMAAVQNELATENTYLSTLALTDPLTGLANRRAFAQQLHTAFQDARRNGTDLALLLIDVDDFKQLNDTWGHPAGDAALVRLGAELRAGTRAHDLAVRYGGEEFALLLPDSGAAAAKALAERLWQQLPSVPWDHRMVALSGGIALLRASDSNPEALVARADAALYEAKRNGKGRFLFAEGEDSGAVAQRGCPSQASVL